MSTLALTLPDFQLNLPFSTHIEERQIRPFVHESLLLDLVPLLGYPVLEAIGQLTIPELVAYQPGVALVADTYYVRYDRVYLATAALEADEPTEPTLTYQPLLTLWLEYLKPYWLRASFARFLAQHGLDITKAGITAPTDPQGTFTRPSSADKAALQASHDTVTEALRSRLTAFLRSETQDYQKDNTTGYNYGRATDCCAATPSHRTRIRGINSRRR